MVISTYDSHFLLACGLPFYLPESFNAWMVYSLWIHYFFSQYFFPFFSIPFPLKFQSHTLQTPPLPQVSEALLILSQQFPAMGNSCGSPQGRSPLFCLCLTVESPSGNLVISHKVPCSFRITLFLTCCLCRRSQCVSFLAITFSFKSLGALTVISFNSV